jgi:hypothetical protein
VRNPADTERPSISAAIVIQDGRVLMVRRRVSEGTLSWQFPAAPLSPNLFPLHSSARCKSTWTPTFVEHGTARAMRADRETSSIGVFRGRDGDAPAARGHQPVSYCSA